MRAVAEAMVERAEDQLLLHLRNGLSDSDRVTISAVSAAREAIPAGAAGSSRHRPA